jgi:hypothetical protein
MVMDAYSKYFFSQDLLILHFHSSFSICATCSFVIQLKYSQVSYNMIVTFL